MSGYSTREAVAIGRHVKAALLHLRRAEAIAAAAGIDIDGGNDTARLIRAAGEAAEDLDLWAVNNAPSGTYQHTGRWCHAPGGQLPAGSWPSEYDAAASGGRVPLESDGLRQVQAYLDQAEARDPEAGP